MQTRDAILIAALTFVSGLLRAADVRRLEPRTSSVLPAIAEAESEIAVLYPENETAPERK
jgi:hypothetical protein